MGTNGSGKATLVIRSAGHPRYQITEGLGSGSTGQDVLA